MDEGDRKAAMIQLTCLVRPVRQRAARLLQTRFSVLRHSGAR